MAEQLILGMWPTISHLLSPKQHSTIRVVHIPHIEPTISHLLSPKQHSTIRVVHIPHIEPTISHLLSPKQHSTIRVVHIPHIDTKRKLLTKAGSTNILVHVVATYDAFQAVLGFLCRHVLRCVLDVHACIDAFAAYNGMV